LFICRRLQPTDGKISLIHGTLVPHYWAKARVQGDSLIRWLKPTATESLIQLAKASDKGFFSSGAEANGKGFLSSAG